MRTLFRQNRIISSIAAELDQKSCWEILTDPQFTQKYFSADERQVFRRHILWTRIVSDRRTLLPDGQIGDLLAYVRREHEHLVLKPNRSYGGQGVLIGHLATRGGMGDRRGHGPQGPGTLGRAGAGQHSRSASFPCSPPTARSTSSRSTR